MLKFVDNLDDFFSYQRGKLSFNKCIRSCMKYMLHYKHICDEKIKGNCQQKMLRKLPALQYWAYEAIKAVGNEYGVHHGPMVPRMLSWSSKPNHQMLRKELQILFTKNNVDVDESLRPRSSELDYFKSLTEDIAKAAKLCEDFDGEEHEGEDMEEKEAVETVDEGVTKRREFFNESSENEIADTAARKDMVEEVVEIMTNSVNEIENVFNERLESMKKKIVEVKMAETHGMKRERVESEVEEIVNKIAYTMEKKIVDKMNDMERKFSERMDMTDRKLAEIEYKQDLILKNQKDQLTASYTPCSHDYIK